MNDIIPIFRDHSDFRGILTYNKISDVKKNGPQSIVKICKDNKLTQCFGVSRFMNSFYDAWKNLKKEGIRYNFGLELIMCNDAKDHTDESQVNNHKVIIFYKGEQGYKDLIRIYSACHTNRENFYYQFRFDYAQLKILWTENLIFVIPFFNSFIHKNLLTFASIIPEFPCKPVIFRELDSDLPFEKLINKALDEFNKNKEFEEQNIKTVCYYKSEDVKSYQIYRCINEKTTFNKPQMEFFCSNKFNFVNYLELNK